MSFNLGNFAGQLSADELNGAMRNAGSDFQFGQPSDAPSGGIQAPTAPTATALPTPKWEQEKEDHKGGGLSNILGLVGQFMGGGYGQALSAVGGMMGKQNG